MNGTPLAESTKYVTFRLEEEIFALDIRRVREVLDHVPPTRVPGAPSFIVGVINLRGNAVPVVDLRRRFGRPETVKTVDTRIIIVEVTADGEPAIIGALADAVREVIDLDPEQISPPPRIGMGLRTDFIRAMGRRDDQFIIIIDIEKVFSVEELTMVVETAPAARRKDALPERDSDRP